jgi:hypothetical protein
MESGYPQEVLVPPPTIVCHHDIKGGTVLEHTFVLAALGLQYLAACELCLEPHRVFSSFRHLY